MFNFFLSLLLMIFSHNTEEKTTLYQRILRYKFSLISGITYCMYANNTLTYLIYKPERNGKKDSNRMKLARSGKMLQCFTEPDQDELHRM